MKLPSGMTLASFKEWLTGWGSVGEPTWNDKDGITVPARKDDLAGLVSIAEMFQSLIEATETRCTLTADCDSLATCIGVGEDEAYFGCDKHCGHGNEDHWCEQIVVHR